MVDDPDRDDLTAKCRALSPREKRVLSAMGKRLRPKEIAIQSGLSFRTVRGYADEARKKLGVASLRDAVVIYAEFEAQEGPPQSAGWQSVGVSDSLEDEAASGGGFSTSPKPEPSGLGGAEPEHSDVLPAKGPAAPFSESPVRPSGELMGRTHDRNAVAGQITLVQNPILRLQRWLAGLGLQQWLVLIVAMALVVIAGFGIAAVCLTGVFEILQQIGSQHR